MNAIVIKDLRKTYRKHLLTKAPAALESLSFEVRENEVFGFLGKNGAGKTTTIKILCGLLRPSAGTASIRGNDVRKREARKLIGYLPENPYFYEYLTPKETVIFYGRLNGLGRNEREREWDRLSEALDLREIGDQRIRSFSKGMRQRLGFAVASVGDPPVLILDEPMSGLDPVGRRLIRDLILRARAQGKTVFFSSHILSDVEQISDRIGMLVDGKLRSVGTIEEILSSRISMVEVIAKDIPEYVAHEIERMALSSHYAESSHHFRLANVEQANDVARKIHAHDGTLVKFTPVKETLEDYFIREQEKVGIEA